MKIFLTLLSFISISIVMNAQDPYIKTDYGIGQYGYIQQNSVTPIRMNSGGHSNVQGLRSRWWTGSERFLDAFTGSCAGGNTDVTTTDINHSTYSDWTAGKYAYISVRGIYCSDNYATTNHNERQFLKLNVDVANEPTFATTVNHTATNHLVGSFTVSCGGVSIPNLKLDRCWLQNTGTAQETDDIPSSTASIKLYYEAITNSETFDGTESSMDLFGNYNSNATNNNIYGHDDLNIPISSAGIRVYVVLQGLANTYTVGRTVKFKIISDGLSFEPSQNASFKMMRIDELNISGSGTITLPVELVDFKAVAKDNTTILNWSTASEKNNDHFDIERSYNATDWQSIATIKGHGTTNLPQQYNYTDVQPNAGVNYYRLKQVDDNGTFTYSKIVSVLIGKGFGLKTYPNPASTELTVLGIDETSSVQILDVTGKIVKTIIGTNLLNINDLQSGVYFIKAYDDAGATLGTTRFVKN